MAETMTNAARVIIAGISSHRSQKANNLLVGLENVSEIVEVIVLLDSDSWLPSQWLQNLVNPLADPKVMVATGSRWYLCGEGKLWSLVRGMALNLGQNALLSCRSFVWGGGMAFRSDSPLCEALPSLWQHALSVDTVVTSFCKRNHWQIVFVPSCLAFQNEDCSLRDGYQMLLRQFVVNRIYDPANWWLAFGLGTPPVLAWLVGALTGLVGLLMGKFLMEAWLLAAVLLSRILGALMICEALGRRDSMRYAPIIVLVDIIGTIAFAHSAVCNQVVWRGITYEIQSVASERRIITTSE